MSHISIPEFPPGKSCRLQLTGDSGRCSTTWVVVSGRKTADLYVIPRILGSAVKVSLHQSGSWQVGMTKEAAILPQSGGSRHWDIWRRGEASATGLVHAWRLIIPDQELRSAMPDAKARFLPPVGAGHAAAIEFLISPNEGVEISFDNALLAGRWRLAGREESYLVVARRIPWTSDDQLWASSARERAVSQAEAAGVRQAEDHRYIFTGYYSDGLRFGLELAAP